MGLREDMAGAFATMRDGAFSDAKISVRTGGREYDGLRTTTEGRDTAGGMGAIQGASGAVRLRVSELSLPYPAAGDAIEVKEQSGNDWQSRVVLSARYDQLGATVRLDYGEKYG
jgi:hypothetical protein